MFCDTNFVRYSKKCISLAETGKDSNDKKNPDLSKGLIVVWFLYATLGSATNVPICPCYLVVCVNGVKKRVNLFAG